MHMFGMYQAQGNQQMGQRRIEQVSKDATLERQKAILKKPITDSPSRQSECNYTNKYMCTDADTTILNSYLCMPA